MTKSDNVPAPAGQHYYELGLEALYRTHRYEDALYYFTEFLQYHRTDEKAHEQKLIALMRLDRFREAIHAADFLIELNMCNPSAYCNKALAYGFLDYQHEALQTIDQGIARMSKRLNNLSSSDNAEELRKGIEELRKMRTSLGMNEQYVRLVRNRQTETTITLSQENLQSGTYIVGVQGSGKTSILTQVALEQIKLGECVIVLDPTGDMCKDIILRMPEERIKDTYYLSLKQFQFPFSLNLFSYPDAGSVGFEARNAARNQIYQAFYKIFPETSDSVYFKGILRNLIPILLDHPAFTIFHIEDFLLDKAFREKVLKQFDHPRVKRFWEKFGRLPEKQRQDESAPFLRRLEELLDDLAVANHIGQKKGLLDIRKAILNKEILLIHLPLDEMAYSNAAPIIGTFLLMQIYAATFSFSAGKRPGFSLLVDEFSKFAYVSGDEFTNLFAFGRKYAIRQVLCHQYSGQLNEEDLQSIKEGLTSAYTVIALRTNQKDSRELAPLFLGLTRRPTDIETDVFAKMSQHKMQSVREFWWHVIKPLQDKVKENSGSSYGQPVYAPFSHDFGFGIVDGIDPLVVRDMLQKLNNLLYYSQKKGRVDEEKRRDFIVSYAKLAQAKTTKRMLVDIRDEKSRKIRSLEKDIQASRRYLAEWRNEAIAIEKETPADWLELDKLNRRRLDLSISVSATQRDLPKMEEELEKVKKAPETEWQDVEVPDERIIAAMIDTVLASLIDSPIATTEAELPVEDIAELLKGLPNRQGLAKIEGRIYEIQTIDLPHTIDKEKIASRWNTIEAQTKRKYCKGRREIENDIERIYTNPFPPTGHDQPHDLVE